MEQYSYEKEHLRVLRALAPECTVLLRSNGDFPLDAPGKLALYGGGARHTYMGGTGSGEVNTRYRVSVEEGLRAAGFTITTERWLDAYDDMLRQARRDFVRAVQDKARKEHKNPILEGMGAVMTLPDYEFPLSGEGDTAVYILSRICGEGADRKAEAGDVRLSRSEVRDILALNRQYPRFLLVLNVGAPVDLLPLSEVKNILLLSQLGIDTGHVLADLLTGRAYPSGKLTATWSAWESYCEEGQFGAADETQYREGVYVGYRYFDSIARSPLFPFGFGLGYTDFALSFLSAEAEGEEIRVRASVRNTGKRKGRETAQLYLSVPAKTLDAPFQTLCAFAKTRELSPGETDELTLSFRLSDAASYDTVRQRWFLDSGDYVLRLGTSSANAAPCALLRLNREVVTREVRNSCGVPGFADWKPERRRTETLPEGLSVVLVDASAFETRRVTYGMPHEVDAVVRGIPDRKLVYLNVGAITGGAVSGVIGGGSQLVAGAAGETTGRLSEYGFAALSMADGPAGLRLSRRYYTDGKGAHAMEGGLTSLLEFAPRWQAAVLGRVTNRKPRRGAVIHEQYATAIPIGTAIAQSWNLALAERCGDIVGAEMERFGVDLWLAPALNIQRDIRCGRNFEYLSEDPLLSGLFAAALCRGVQKHPGRAATIKHFAANNQETNRYNNNSQVSERAMREIYLRGFEVCIREGQPLALMTSYNLLNGVHTSEHRALLEDILRCEFGFDGVVMTDWIAGRSMLSRGAKYPAPAADRIAAAGGDLVMPGEQRDIDDLLKGLKKGTVSRDQLEINATRLLSLVRRLRGR